MEDENIGFGEFLAVKLKEKGFSLKRISDATGIAPAHIENLLRDEFEAMPSAPYLRGYLLRLGRTLGFSGEEWWAKLKSRGVVKNSGEADTLPRNRFMKKAPTKYIWSGIIAAIVILYVAFALPHAFGKPSLSISFPSSNPYTTTSNTLMFQGTLGNANTLTLNGDPITIAPDGTWQKGVLLENGLNSFTITAKKFLGGTVTMTEQIIYEGPTSTSTASGTAPSVHFETSTPGPGPSFE